MMLFPLISNRPIFSIDTDRQGIVTTETQRHLCVSVVTTISGHVSFL